MVFGRKKKDGTKSGGPELPIRPPAPPLAPTPAAAPEYAPAPPPSEPAVVPEHVAAALPSFSMPAAVPEDAGDVPELDIPIDVEGLDAGGTSPAPGNVVPLERRLADPPPAVQSKPEGLPVHYYIRLIEIYGYPRDAAKRAKIKNERALIGHITAHHPITSYLVGRIYDIPALADRGRQGFLNEHIRGDAYLFNAYWTSVALGDEKLKELVGETAITSAPHLSYKIAQETRNDTLLSHARARLKDADPLLGVIIGWIAGDDSLATSCADVLVDAELAVAWKIAKRFEYDALKTKIGGYVMDQLDLGKSVSLTSPKATGVELLVGLFS